MAKSTTRNRITLNILHGKFFNLNEKCFRSCPADVLHPISSRSALCLSRPGRTPRVTLSDGEKAEGKLSPDVTHEHRPPPSPSLHIHLLAFLLLCSETETFDVEIFMHVHNKLANRDKWNEHKEKKLVIHFLWTLFKNAAKERARTMKEKFLHSIRESKHSELNFQGRKVEAFKLSPWLFTSHIVVSVAIESVVSCSELRESN
jgi:hypothetical protein